MSYPAEPRGNVFTRQVGPLPMWAWSGIALLAAILFYLWNRNRSSQNNSSVNSPGGVDSSLVPQFVNQTFVENTPPAAPPMKGPEKEPDDDSDDKGRLRGNPPHPPKFFTVTVTKTGWESTLTGIAKHFHVPGGAAALAKLNHIPSNAHLHPGQKLKVPFRPPGVTAVGEKED